MGADVVTIAGHRCERGSEAEQLFLYAQVCEGRWPVRGGRRIVTLYDAARRAPGYLGPADMEGRTGDGGGRG